MIEAVLFDLDGLLTDTETLHYRAYRQTLAEIGRELPEELYAEMWIRDGRGIRDLCTMWGLEATPETLRERKAVLYHQLVRTELQPMPGAVELLKQLHGRKRLALATASWREQALCVTDTLGVTALFEVVVTGSEVERAKPHPDIFLLAAARLGVPAERCVVVEDAEKGIRAAQAAGMRVIAVPNRHTHRHDFSGATWRLTTLAEAAPILLEPAEPMPGNNR